MCRPLTMSLVVLACVPLMLAAAFTIYDFTVFLPRRAEIGVLASGTGEPAPPPVLALVRVSVADLPGQAARILMSELPAPRVASGQIGWHLTGMLWSTLVRLHLSEGEQLTLIVARAPMGPGVTGYPAAARAYFHKPLAALSLEETAGLVAIGVAPGAWLHAPDRHARLRERLLRRLQETR